jgi:hypothetical protein
MGLTGSAKPLSGLLAAGSIAGGVSVSAIAFYLTQFNSGRQKSPVYLLSGSQSRSFRAAEKPLLAMVDTEKRRVTKLSAVF